MSETRELYLGLDVGSTSVKAVLCDAAGAILEHHYQRHNGRPYKTALALLRDLFARFPTCAVRAVGVTGTGGEKLARLMGGRFINEVVAQSRAVMLRTPRARTVIEMGGQDSKLLIFEPDESGRPALRDFSMNALCAAGTGSFVDQQASRLGVAIEEEFGRLALVCEHPPHMAGRCSVFAKSDMIHLQQIATPVQDIVAGLCFALARNFRSTIGQGKSFHKPVAFQGGVASNKGMVRAFEEVLELPRGELIVDPLHAVMGAIGAAQLLIDERADTPACRLDVLEEHALAQYEAPSDLAPLAEALSPETPGDAVPLSTLRDGEQLDVFLGIDVGSVSTNVVLIDRAGRLVAKRYLATAGRPIEAVRRGIEEIYEEVGDRVVVRGCATTGSGRYLIGDLVGADLIRNEITAQATAAIAIDPTVDTIFEIGGQDSKYISIHEGAVCDFEMNKACAAGTGSFLEEQAERLGLSIKEEFAGRALESRCPVSLGDRCTVFMESDLLHHQQNGACREDLVAGLAYSIVYNYLNRVVGDRRIGRRIFFQGGTAFNKAVVAAFNRVLGKPVVVPAHHEVTGAIGVALLARETIGESKFKGFDWSNRQYEVETFLCKRCANSCEIRRVQVENDRPLFYGSRCERFEVDRGVKANDLPDLFAERAARLRAALEASDFPPATRGKVGIPMTLLFHEFLPLWATFFRALGYEVVLSGDSTKAIIHEGIEQVVVETCFPVKLAHGHIAALLRQDVDFIFLPSVINTSSSDFGPRDRWNFNCPLIQTIPYTIRAAAELARGADRLFSPVLYMQSTPRQVFEMLARHRTLLKCSRRELRDALRRGFEAQEAFGRWLAARGREALDALRPDEKAIVVVGRPYNSCDGGVNLDIPKRLRALGVQALPMDMLPLDATPLMQDWRRMYWRYGQRILKAGDIVRRDARLFAVYITNFSCGPDSFLISFFEHVLGEKPYLQIEIDEHSADAGAVTRCEAFLDTLANYGRGQTARATPPPSGLFMQSYTDHRTIFLPNMAPQAYAVEAAMRAAGMDARVMETSDGETLALGRKYTTGKECYPALLTAGDMIRQARRPDFDPRRSAFFMGAADGPCRFGQYNSLHRMILDELGLREVPLYVIDQDEEFGHDVKIAGGNDFERRAWLGICAIDALEQVLLATRPYEVEPGAAQTWFDTAVRAVCDRIVAREPIEPALVAARAAFANIQTRGRGGRVKIGIVGEIYVRENRFANDDLIGRIEALGGQAIMPTMAEWLHYSREMRVRRKWWRRSFGSVLSNKLRGAWQIASERRIYRLLGWPADPPVQQVIELARPYVDSSFEGETILALGKSVEMVRDHGACGIINTMPFTCMPGTIVTALLRRMRDEYHGVPVLTMTYTGQQNLTNQIRLEAFMFQARRFQAGAEAPAARA